MKKNSFSNEDIKKIEKLSKKYYRGASGCHDWSHVERVLKLAIKIGREEQADLKILKVSSLLHDIGRKNEMKTKGAFCHAENGSREAKKILGRMGFSKDAIKKVVQPILTHRFRNSHIPDTLEAKILYDADKLDSIGAVGIARTFLFAGHSGAGTMYTGNEKKLAKKDKDFSYTKEDSGYMEYEVKLKKIKNKMLTKTGKKMAKERSLFMKRYFEKFWNEIKGLS